MLVYVRMVNDTDRDIPMYWWTNISVEETAQSRGFSSAGEVIYIDPRIGGFGAGKMPYLPTVPESDISYPLNFPFSNEYFFQTPEYYKAPWEAVVYEDSGVFYERSTSLLRYRKMFCWGNHAGGRRWCDFLAKPGEGNYIEIQGGLAPTQLNGLDMPAHSVWDFTQIFGVSEVDTNVAYQNNWDDAYAYIQEEVERNISEAKVYTIHDKLQALDERLPEEMLHTGSGWGTLERIRREKTEGGTTPKGCFLLIQVLNTRSNPGLFFWRQVISQIVQSMIFPHHGWFRMNG